ncbi:hypothetical protein DSO57_1023908 [Entomophthora muscae]|uniref:Uncharacterized protein n=1 Tax=Entomophthora muscae TaxID=34485 RepID=A0ACC2T307_9FUNG|nr:hypothetical protein DSO57_1023908 [Entomophthora muscae]
MSLQLMYRIQTHSQPPGGGSGWWELARTWVCFEKKIPRCGNHSRSGSRCGARPGPQKLCPSLDGFGWTWAS